MTAVTLTAVSLLACPFAAMSADRSAGFAPDRTAWKLTVTPEVLDKYLDFPNSQIGSVIRIAVFYESVDGSSSSKPIRYKNFYYDRQGKPLDSKQMQMVTFAPETRGPIIVKASDKSKNEAAMASANVAMRLFLDLYTSKNFPQFIVVDDDIMPVVGESAKKMGFKPFTLPLSRDLRPKPKAIMLMKSNRSDRFEYYMYQ